MRRISRRAGIAPRPPRPPRQRRPRASLFLAAALLLAAGCGGPKRTAPVSTAPGPAADAPGTSGPPRDYRPVLPALLQVGLLENRDEIVVSAAGPALVLDGDTGRKLARLAGPGDALRCTRGGQGVRWKAAGGEGSAPAVVLQPIDPVHLVRSGDQAFRGEFLLTPSPVGGGVTLINSVDLEAYLQGVVPWEIGRHGPGKFAAVQAQAVAARTYTIAHLGARRDRGFDVFADVMDQVYKGAAGEDSLCNRAVRSTAGLVLQHDGVEINAYYSACCGGASSNVHEVWARPASPYLVSRADGPDGHGRAFCGASKYFTWETAWSGNRLTDILQETLPAYVAHMAEFGRAEWAGTTFTPARAGADHRRPGALLDLAVASRTTSGRVDELLVTTEAGVYRVRGDRCRWVLPPADGNPFILRSALFELDVERRDGRPHRVTARGHGFGHGIGMCQTGALARAEQGQDLAAILGHYYPGAKLVRLDVPGGRP